MAGKSIGGTTFLEVVESSSRLRVSQESRNLRQLSNIKRENMKTFRFSFPASSSALGLALAATLALSGCTKNQPPAAQQSQTQPMQPAPQNSNQAMTPQQSPQQAVQAPPPQNAMQRQPQQPAPPPAPLVIPAGTHIRVTTGQDLGSKLSQPGQSFSATVAGPVVIRGVTVIRSGASATGTVVDAKPLGRFKGGATLQLRLDSVRAEGRTYEVASSTIDRVENGKGKRTATMVGGGGGLGAIIGGIAGGGKGALIGGLAGAGAGTAGSAFSGNKEIVIPAETPLTFRLERAVTVSR